MKYGKMKDGQLVEAPKIIKEEGKVIYQPSHETYINNGYKPVAKTPYPEQGNEEKFYMPQYIEEDSQIVQVWVEAKTEETEPKEV